MSAYIKAPRAVRDKWWHRPWREVVAAAESHEDGLCIEAPDLHYLNWCDVNRAKLPPDMQERYDKAINHVFFAEGEDRWGKGKTLLYRQNW